jgi:hypothetical protein
MRRVMGAALLVLALAGCTANDHHGGQAAAQPTPPAGAPTTGSTASVSGSGLGPLTVAISQPTPSTGKAWLEDGLTISNRSNDVVYIQDPRSGHFLDNGQVLFTTDGCGYGLSGSQAQVACQMDYRPIALAAHQSHVLSLALWKGLPGMRSLSSSAASVNLTLRYRSTNPYRSPDDQRGVAGLVSVRYRQLT